MTTLRFILLSQSVLAIFIAGGLFFKYDEIKSRSIAVFVFLFGFEIGVYLYSTSEIIFIYPQFAGLFYFPIGFVYGPLLLAHITSIQGKVLTKKFLLHFLPVLIMVILILDIYAMDGLERIAYSKANFINRIMPYNYARAIHTIIYGIVCGVLIKRHYYRDSFERLYSFAICLIYFLAAILISFFTLFADGWRDFIYYYLVANSIVLLIGYLLYSKPDFLKELSKKYFKSSLDKDSMKRIKLAIEKEMEESHAYLDRGLNLNKMAERIGESNHRISQTMSILIGKNFNEYVNYLRVEHAKNMLTNPKFDHYKIEAIALDSGFSNKVTFNKAFTKFTDKTPSAFRFKS